MKKILCLMLTLLAIASTAHADSGSTSGSCSGTIKNFGYFYAYTYQYAYLYDGRVESESHSFSFSGFLSGMEKAEIVGGNGRHVIYRGNDFELAVPYKAGAGLYFKSESFPGGPGESGWVKLCSY